MSAYKTDQRRLLHRGREFHFVSYEGQHANPARGIEETPANWCLMIAGKRWEVMPQVAEQEPGELEEQLHAWLDENLPAGRQPKAISRA